MSEFIEKVSIKCITIPKSNAKTKTVRIKLKKIKIELKKIEIETNKDKSW